MKCSNGRTTQIVLSAFAVLFLITLVVMAILNLRVTSKDYLARIITKDVTRLVKILERIDKECKILSFDYQKNPINFLNVGTFQGSEIGPMNIAYPKKWQGPYLNDNPTCAGKEYLVVRTKKGYFVTPGEGVALPNGKVVGKDVMLDENADIKVMCEDAEKLMFAGVALAERLKIRVREKLAVEMVPLERI